MKNSLMIFGLFVLGVLAGFFSLLPQSLLEADAGKYALYALMFLVGIGMGGNRKALAVIKKVHIKIVFVPLTVVVGTFAGVAVLSLFLPGYSLRECLAVGAGFGYYSLSSLLITELHSETLGAVALLANISREIITLLAAPLMARYFGKIAPIAAGGATSMDTTLPIISAVSGKEYGVIAVFNGTVLTVLIPFLVPLILTLFR